MQTPGLYDPQSVEAIVNALRGQQGVQLAGDVVPFAGMIRGGDYQKTGPAASGSIEQLYNLKSVDPAARANVKLMPTDVWKSFQARQGIQPPVAVPSWSGLPGPRGGGNLPPKY